MLTPWIDIITNCITRFTLRRIESKRSLIIDMRPLTFNLKDIGVDCKIHSHLSTRFHHYKIFYPICI